jgi:hypothetical protein
MWCLNHQSVGWQICKIWRSWLQLGYQWCKQTTQVIDNKTTQYQHTNYICNFSSNSVVTQEVWAFNLWSLKFFSQGKVDRMPILTITNDVCSSCTKRKQVKHEVRKQNKTHELKLGSIF